MIPSDAQFTPLKSSQTERACVCMHSNERILGLKKRRHGSSSGTGDSGKRGGCAPGSLTELTDVRGLSPTFPAPQEVIPFAWLVITFNLAEKWGTYSAAFKRATRLPKVKKENFSRFGSYGLTYSKWVLADRHSLMGTFSLTYVRKLPPSIAARIILIYLLLVS